MIQPQKDDSVADKECIEGDLVADGDVIKGEEGVPTSAPVKRCLVAACKLALIPVTFFSLIAFLGRSHWTIELTTHFRFQYFFAAVFLMLALLFLRKTQPAIIAAMLLLINGFFVLPVYGPVEIPQQRTRSIRILFSNVYLENEEYESVRRLVSETQPDIVFLAETHKHWTDQTDQLKSEYPYSVRYRAHGAAAIVGYSRIKLEQFEVQWAGEPSAPMIFAQTKLDGQQIKIIGAHTESPGDAASLQARTSQMQHLAELTGKSEVPVAIIGDLNVTPWSPYFNDMLRQGKLRDSRRGFGNHATWQTSLPMLRIPIDHCLISEEIVIERREICRDVGSDHFPLLVELSVVRDSDAVAQKQKNKNAISEQLSSTAD